MLISATILVNVERGSTNEVAQSIVDIDGVENVFSVTGRFDLVVLVKVKDMEALSKISNEHFDKIEKIKSVETLVSMKVFSNKELEDNFSVGV